MIKDDNKRVSITLTPNEMNSLDDFCDRLDVSKTELLMYAFKKFISLDDATSIENEKTIRLVHLMENRTLCDVVAITGEYIIYTFGLSDRLRVITVDSCYIGLDNFCTDDEILENLLYEVMVS